MIAARTATETVNPARFLSDIADGLAAFGAGGRAHDQATTLLIDAGAVESAIADALAPEADEPTPLGDRFRALTVGLARLHLATWRGAEPAIRRLVASATVRLTPLLYQALPAEVRLRIPEGFAYHGLYPEQYAAAAWRIVEERTPDSVTVLGLRSIGTTLSATVVAALEERGVPCRSFTVRPRGHPFDRRLVPGPGLSASLTARPGDWFLLVDDGPGLSGSSLAGAADFLSERGVPDERIILMPAWLPPIERLRSADARLRWRRHDAVAIPLRDALGRPSPLHLTEGTEDLSGGRWRTLLPGASLARVAVQPQHERLKYLEREPRTGRRVLWKFAGLGRHGTRRWERAERLSQAGFTARPVDLAAGLLGTRFLEGTPARTGYADPELLETAASYLAWLRLNEPADRGTARGDFAALVETNVAEGLGERWRDRAESLARGPEVEPVALDARMFPHDWVRTRAGWRKLDALDHHDDDFLPGPTDVAWDIAGMAVEFQLSDQGREHLLERYVALSGDRDIGARLPWQTAAYLAFRFGYASVAQEALGDHPEAAAWRRERARYRRLLAGHLERHAKAPPVPVAIPARTRLIIFDAPGTLHRDTAPGEPSPSPHEWQLLPGVRAHLRELDFSREGYRLGVTANLDPVAATDLSEATARRLLTDLLQAATGVRVPLEAVRCCRHTRETPCTCRLPAPGMLTEIMAHHGVSPAETLFVGESEHDQEAARRAGARFRWAHDFFARERQPS